jgi:SHS2 domain-containing protein
MPFEIVEHRADVGISVRGETLAELFADAARGMFFVICEQPPEGWPESHTITIRAADAEQLLVDWLSELLYLFEVKKFFTVAPEIESIETTQLRATVRGAQTRGVSYDTEIKAVTHHLLSIDRTLNGFETIVYFDL